MRTINRSRQFFTVGVDIYAQYLNECKSQGIHDECVLSAVRVLPFKEKSFGIVFCGQFLEHLEKEDGWRLIREMEKIASKRVVISTPVGEYRVAGPWENPYLEHKSSWSPNELRASGYQVRGSSLPIAITINEGLAPRLPRSVRGLFIRFVFILSALANPVVHFFPNLAGNMVCVKNLDEE